VTRRGFRALVCAALGAMLLGCPSEPVEDEPTSSLDDDDATEIIWPDCPWALVQVERDPALPPITDAMKLWVGAYRPGDVEPAEVPRAEPIASGSARGLGPLEGPNDRYSVPLCVPPGEVAVVLMLDTNWDDDACTAGDYLGFGTGTFADDGEVIEAVLDHLLTEQDCHHGQ